MTPLKSENTDIWTPPSTPTHTYCFPNLFEIQFYYYESKICYQINFSTISNCLKGKVLENDGRWQYDFISFLEGDGY